MIIIAFTIALCFLAYYVPRKMRVNLLGLYTAYSSKYCSVLKLNGYRLAGRLIQSYGLSTTIALDNEIFCEKFVWEDNQIVLQKDICFENSITATAATIHEIGHAIEFKRNRKSFRILEFTGRKAVKELINLLSTPTILLGFILFNDIIVATGIMFLILSIINKALFVRLEYNADKKAIHIINTNLVLTDSEKKMILYVLQKSFRIYIAELLLVPADNLLSLFISFKT